MERMLGGATVAGFVVAVALALAPGLHGGGVNTASGDGSVRFISGSIDVTTLRALSSQDGGEVVSVD